MEYYIPIWFVLPIDSSLGCYQEPAHQSICNSFQNNLASNSSFDKEKWQKYLQIFRSYLEKKGKKLSKKLWTKQEDELLMKLSQQGMSWEYISKVIQQANPKICQRRFQRLKQSFQRWPKQLDDLIKTLSQTQKLNWTKIHEFIYSSKEYQFPKHSVKQIKQRYLLNLRPGIMTEEWTVSQDIALLNIIKERGTHWRKLSEIIPGRTQLQLKNRFYGTLKPLQKKVLRKLSYYMKQQINDQNFVY